MSSECDVNLKPFFVHVFFEMLVIHDIPFWGTFARCVGIGVHDTAGFVVGFIVKLQDVGHHLSDIQADIVEVDFIIQFITFSKIANDETTDVVDFFSADFH